MKKVFAAYWDVLKGFRGLTTIVILLMGLSGLMEGAALLMLIPLLSKGFGITSGGHRSDYLLEHTHFTSQQWIVVAILSFFALGLLSAILKFFSDRELLQLRARVENNLRQKLVRSLFLMRWTSFINLRVGDLGKGMLSEIHQTISGLLCFLQCLTAAIVVGILTCLAMYISIRMTCIVLLFGLIALIGYKTSSRRMSRKGEFMSSVAGAISNNVEEGLGNLKFFKSMGLAGRLRDQLLKFSADYSSAIVDNYIYNVRIRFLFEVTGVLFVAGFLGYSLLLSKLPLAESLVFLSIFYRLAPRIIVVQDQYYLASSLHPWYLNWKSRFELIVREQEIEVSGSQAVQPTFNRSLQMRGISYRFPNGRLVLDSIDWELKKGSFLAIVGESGGGKTTMIDLITGLLKPSDGMVFLDDRPFDSLDLGVWRSKIGLVMQETPILYGTVLENITSGEGIPDRAKARKCAEMVDAWDFIQNLPQGLDTLMEARSHRLSRGESQRIGLARALYRDPWLLILDEATSALDADSEAHLYETLKSLKGPITIFMITHRLKIADLADEILMLQTGQIVERGTWAQLMSKKQEFRRMAEIQGLTK